MIVENNRNLPLELSTWKLLSSGLAKKCRTRLKTLAGDKHQSFISKKFFLIGNVDDSVQDVKVFSSSLIVDK
jgi:hypothetical protein